MSFELAFAVFDSPEGAELSYGRARTAHPEDAWVQEIALVEMHHGGRVSVRGTFGDRYVGMEEIGDVTGPSAATGALTGGLIGAVFGPPGFVFGLIVGLMAGGRKDAEDAELPTGEFLDELRRDLDPGKSAIVLLADKTRVDEMTAALEGAGPQIMRRPLTEDQVKWLEESLPYIPPAIPGEYS